MGLDRNIPTNVTCWSRIPHDACSILDDGQKVVSMIPQLIYIFYGVVASNITIANPVRQELPQACGNVQLKLLFVIGAMCNI